MEVFHFYNGKIYLNNGKFVNEFYVKDGKFTFEKQINSIDIDLNGKFVLPGLIDSHTHFVSAGLNRLGAFLGDVKRLDELFSYMSEYIEKYGKKRKVLFGYEFDETKTKENRMPTKDELDKISKEFPFFIKRIDLHSMCVNSKFEEVYNVKSDNGIIKGTLYDEMIIKTGNFFTEEDMKEGMFIVEKEALSHGITTLFALEGWGDDFTTIDFLLKEKDHLTIDAVIYPQVMAVDEMRKRGFDRIGGCILLDGSLGSRTAALKEEYADDKGNFGKLYHTDENLYYFVKKAHLNKMQLAFHAIGDRAIEQIIKIYERVLSEYPDKNHRHRIEHFIVADDSLIEKAAKLGLYIDMQPTFEYFWGGEGELYWQRVGKKRSNLINRFGSVKNAGMVYGFGSDADVTPLNPFLGISGALSHHLEKERLNVFEAIDGYSINNAKIGFLEDKLGDISEGKDADFLIVSDDIFSMNHKDIGNILPEVVYKKGVIVYERRKYED